MHALALSERPRSRVRGQHSHRILLNHAQPFRVPYRVLEYLSRSAKITSARRTALRAGLRLERAKGFEPSTTCLGSRSETRSPQAFEGGGGAGSGLPYGSHVFFGTVNETSILVVCSRMKLSAY